MYADVFLNDVFVVNNVRVVFHVLNSPVGPASREVRYTTNSVQ